MLQRGSGLIAVLCVALCKAIGLHPRYISEYNCSTTTAFLLSSFPNSRHSKPTNCLSPHKNQYLDPLDRRVFFVIIINRLNARIAEEHVVTNSSEERHRESLRGAGDEALEGRHGTNASGAPRHGTRAEELGVAVHQPFGLAEKSCWSDHARSGAFPNRERGQQH